MTLNSLIQYEGRNFRIWTGSWTALLYLISQTNTIRIQRYTATLTSLVPQSVNLRIRYDCARLYKIGKVFFAIHTARRVQITHDNKLRIHSDTVTSTSLVPHTAYFAKAWGKAVDKLYFSSDIDYKEAVGRQTNCLSRWRNLELIVIRCNDIIIINDFYR